jgi:hypothetical protein
MFFKKEIEEGVQLFYMKHPKKSSVTILIPSKQMLQYVNLLNERVPNHKYYKLADISQGVEQEVK